MHVWGVISLHKTFYTLIINKSEEIKKTKKDKGGDLTPRQKKELTEEEKECKSKRKEIQEKLIKFATRIPIFMYLTDFREYSLKDVITQFEPGLFKKVTGLSVNDFELLVSIGIFNDSLMNSAVYNFKRYEDSSLEYTGISRHSVDENVGLFSTVISRADYEEMAAAQATSMKGTHHNQTITVKEEKKTETKPKHTQTIGFPVPGLDQDRKINTEKEESGMPPKIDISKLRVGTIVFNEKYGEGKVTGFKPGKILVSFPEVLKMFQMPQGFELGHLKVKEW